MTVVLDTNVFLSALITPGNCRKILELWSTGTFKIVISREILQEIDAVGKHSTFRKYFSLQQLEELLKFIKENCIFVESKKRQEYKKFTSDLKDVIFVGVAMTVKVECLVTGNVKHFKQFGKTKIVTSAEFLKLFV
jgi:putative PIN family toxin of toxin-antitoxin system